MTEGTTKIRSLLDRLEAWLPENDDPVCRATIAELRVEAWAYEKELARRAKRINRLMSNINKLNQALLDQARLNQRKDQREHETA